MCISNDGIAVIISASKLLAVMEIMMKQYWGQFYWDTLNVAAFSFAYILYPSGRKTSTHYILCLLCRPRPSHRSKITSCNLAFTMNRAPRGTAAVAHVGWAAQRVQNVTLHPSRSCTVHPTIISSVAQVCTTIKRRICQRNIDEVLLLFVKVEILEVPLRGRKSVSRSVVVS